MLFAACAGAFPAWPQTETVPETRAEQVAQERLDKRANMRPGSDSRFEQIVSRFNDGGSIRNLLFGQNGFGLRIGGLPSGSGFGLGPRYYRRDLAGDRMSVEASAVASFRRYWAAETKLLFPDIAGKKFDLEFRAAHSDAPMINYFGSGSGTRKGDKTNYRREDTTVAARIAWKPARNLSVGWITGANFLNIGPGRDSFSPSTEEKFSVASTPGLARQTSYLVYGPYVNFDTRDWHGDPHRGTLLSASYGFYNDYKLSSYSFRRLDAQAEHYIPLLNQTRVIALRARTQLTFVGDGKQLPFYMQPTLGGADDLRGFQRFRFQDNNSMVVNAEYRWEVSPALDMAVFGDAGRVFAKPGQIAGLSDLHGSGGVGFRFKTRNQVIMRFDTGVSREGVRVWLRFSNPFEKLPLFR